MTRLRRRATGIALACIVAAAGGLVGCSDGPDRIGASATFDDVADLADGAPVMMADITIGNVTSIDLAPDGKRAEVHFEVDAAADVPADVAARIRRTSVLGEKFVDLVPASSDPDSPSMQDGAVISDTSVTSDLEQLVATGTDALGALSSTQLAILIDEGAAAVGGKGEQLSTVISNLAVIVDGYERHTAELTGTVDDLVQLSGDLAPAVGTNGDALSNLDVTLAILNANDADFYALVGSLDDLATTGSRLLAAHLTTIRTNVAGVRDVVSVVAGEQEALAEVLRNLPDHNADLPQGERGDFIQVLLDVVVCGVPGGGDVPGDPVDACYPGEGG